MKIITARYLLNNLLFKFYGDSFRNYDWFYWITCDLPAEYYTSYFLKIYQKDSEKAARLWLSEMRSAIMIYQPWLDEKVKNIKRLLDIKGFITGPEFKRGEEEEILTLASEINTPERVLERFIHLLKYLIFYRKYSDIIRVSSIIGSSDVSIIFQSSDALTRAEVVPSNRIIRDDIPFLVSAEQVKKSFIQCLQSAIISKNLPLVQSLLTIKGTYSFTEIFLDSEIEKKEVTAGNMLISTQKYYEQSIYNLVADAFRKDFGNDYVISILGEADEIKEEIAVDVPADSPLQKIYKLYNIQWMKSYAPHLTFIFGLLGVHAYLLRSSQHAALSESPDIPMGDYLQYSLVYSLSLLSYSFAYLLEVSFLHLIAERRNYVENRFDVFEYAEAFKDYVVPYSVGLFLASLVFALPIELTVMPFVVSHMHMLYNSDCIFKSGVDEAINDFIGNFQFLISACCNSNGRERLENELEVV